MTRSRPSLRDLVWPHRTERLSLRPVQAHDAAALREIRALPAVYHGLSSAPTDLPTFTESLLRPERAASTLVIDLEGRVIGDLMVKIGDAWAQLEVQEQAKGVEAELGWTLDPAYGGRGYATEAVAALVELCFTQLGLRRVTAGCFADNIPSWRLMERLGMRRENATLEAALHRDGTWRDGYDYALLKSEWLERQRC